MEKLGPQHPHTLASIKNLIELYEAWNKPEEAQKWRAKIKRKIQEYDIREQHTQIQSRSHEGAEPLFSSPQFM